eukprot:TRINITY_DN12877_c0_g1_i1.p2 TRINITY_DN12877_c0_g1~~TRINITY_DN12877_c0_g1_i1.p2  ORF type:complete len:100 (+),score=3.87 TRINITY_DN12877_c0_g1_i1:277-576(+)
MDMSDYCINPLSVLSTISIPILHPFFLPYQTSRQFFPSFPPSFPSLFHTSGHRALFTHSTVTHQLAKVMTTLEGISTHIVALEVPLCTCHLFLLNATST